MATALSVQDLVFVAWPGVDPYVICVPGPAPVVRVTAEDLVRYSRFRGFDFDGGRLVLEPETGGRVVYRVAAYDEDTDTYLLIWPD
jgi:hypothetical protein